MYELPNIQHIRHLYMMQKTGKSQAARTRARNELQKISKNLQDVANQRLRRLEKSPYDYGSTYDATKRYLEQRGTKGFTLAQDLRGSAYDRKNRFKEVSATSYEDILRMRRFVASKETTIHGQQAIEKKRFNTYRAQHIFARDMDDNELREFLRFLGNSGIDEYLDYYNEKSGDEVEEMAYVFGKADDKEREDIKALFREFDKFNKGMQKVKEGTLDVEDVGGLSFKELRQNLNKVYENIEKRQRS